MKSKFYIIASILAVICLICSCGGGGGSADGEAQKVGALSFSVVTDGPEMVLSITNPNIMSGATYQYKATPNFNNEFGTPQGQTDWADLTLDTESGNYKGSDVYFAQGSWSFEVRVIIKGSTYASATSTDFTLLYKTAAAVTQYINAGSETDSNNVTHNNNVVEVTVVRQIDNGANGTLNVNGVTAPAASDADDLVITYGRIGATMAQLAVIDSATVANGLSTFTNNSISVAPGIYVMTFTVKDKYGNEVGATTKTVEIVKNVTTPVTGSIDAGKWVATSFTVKGVKTITCSASITATSFDQGDTITITFSGYISDGGTETAENITYYFCDGMNAPVSIGSHAGSSEQTYTYNWVTTSVARGYWYPCIIAADSTGNLITNNTDPTPLKVTIQ